MAQLNFRKVPDNLKDSLKKLAVDSGMGLEEYCLHLLALDVVKGTTVANFPVPTVARLRPNAESVKEGAAVFVTGGNAAIDPVERHRCPRCGSELIPWGSMQRCENCARNY